MLSGLYGFYFEKFIKNIDMRSTPLSEKRLPQVPEMDVPTHICLLAVNLNFPSTQVPVTSSADPPRSKFAFNEHTEKKRFAGLANRIFGTYIEPTNFLYYPDKILVPPKDSFIGSRKGFVGKTKIFMGQQKKSVGSISTIQFANLANIFYPCNDLIRF